ncbi:universal stress protein [Myxococcota bacterium]|nr:universal stress protein [Myxococcota bacterium]
MVGYEVIIAAIDLSELSERAVEAAVEVARRFHARRVHVVHVVRDPPTATIPQIMPESLEKQVISEAVAMAQRELDRIPTPEGAFRFTREVRVGVPAKQLTAAAIEVGANMIVVASHGYGPLRRVIVGSVAGDLVQAAPCPVLVVGRERPLKGELAKVLVAIDFSPISELLLRHAVALAAPSAGAVRALAVQGLAGVVPGDDVVVILSPDETEQVMRRHYENLEALVARIAGIDARVVGEVTHSPRPAGAILDVAEREESDLLVIGASGHGAWHRALLGSTAMKVLSHARCPVLLVPRESPIRVGALASVAAT